LVEKLDRPLMEAIVADLLATNRLKEEWRVKNRPSTAAAEASDTDGDDPIFTTVIERMRREGRLTSPGEA
jgi:hypothetical protein